MELELGLKITRTRENVSSSVDFHFSKDPFGPLVLSQETDSRFIIIIHLKGFKKEGIEIDINKQGNRITVRGRKPVEEMVMIRWMAWRKEVEFRVFKKVFRIPDIVDLDKVNARFDDDDATLTITMPKRVKGVSGLKIEEEEEEEKVEFGDVSEAGEVKEESIEREEFDEQFETEIPREEEFEELEEEQKDEEETEVDNLEKIDHIDEQDKILEGIREEEEEEELADSNKESEEDSSIRKLPDIEGRDSHEQTRHEEQVNKVVEQQDSQAETHSDDFGSRAFEETEEQEPDEQLDRTSESGSAENKTKDDDGDGLSKVQGTEEEAERRNEERKNQEIVEGETGGHEKNKIVKMKFENRDAKEEVDGKMGEGFTPNVDRTQVVGEEEIAETDTKAVEFGYDKLQEDKVDKIHELVEKKEEKGGNAKVRRKREGKSLTKLQENLVEEKTPEAGNDIPKPVQETEVPEVDTLGKKGDDGKEKKKTVKMDIKNGDAKEEVDEKMGEGFTPNITETETKADESKSDKLESDEVQKLVEKKKKEEENDKVGTKSEDNSLVKLQEFEEEQFQGQKRHEKQEQIKKLAEEKTIGNGTQKPVQEIEVPKEAGDEGEEGKEKKKIVQMEIKNGDAKEEVDVKMGEGFTANIEETETKTEEFESNQLKADEVDKIQKLVEKKEKDEENAKVGAQSEDTGEQKFQGQKRDDKKEKIKELVEEQTPETEANIGNDVPKLVQDRCEEIKKQPEEYKEKIMETGKNINDAAAARKVQEIIRQQELDEPSRCKKERKTRELVKCKTNDEEKKEKEIAETETTEQESYRPKILREQEKIEELAEEKTKFSKNRKVKEEEEIAEKKTEFGDDYDDILRKVRDTEQRDSKPMKGQEEKDMIQELVLEGDEGKGIMAEAENDKSKKFQEIDEQQSHEEVTCGKQLQKFIGGEISGLGEVEDVKKETDVSEEYRGVYRNEHDEEKQDEADRPEKITGKIEQEFVKLNSQLEQDNIEDGEKTQELVEEKIKDCEEEECSEKSKTTTDDDVVRKVQGIKKQELYEQKELVEEKTDDHEKEEENEISESQIEAECGSLRKVDGSEEHELHEPKIHKERDKTRITMAEEPSGQEKEKEEEKIVESMKITENDNSIDVQEITKEQPEKPESHEKQYKIQEVVEAGHDDHKEEKVMAELETEKQSSKKVQETEQQEYDGMKRSMVQDKMQETEETEETRAKEEKEIVEKRTKTKDGSSRKIRDDEDPELIKPYKRQKEDKIQELVEMGTSVYREKVKKQDEDDILRSQEAGKPDLDEFERHGEPSNIPQLVGEEKMENIAQLREKMEDDSSGKFHDFEEVKLYEDWTHEEREKREDLVKEEVTDPKDEHTVGESLNDHKEKQQDEKVIAKAELKTEENSSKKVQDIEKHECDELKRSMLQEKMQETEEKGKTRAMDEKEIVERRKKTEYGNLRKVRGDEDPELSKPYKIPDLDGFERPGEQCNIPQLVGEEKVENIAELGEKMEDDSSGKFHEFEERKSYEDWTYEQREKRKDLVKEEATDLKDRYTGGKGHNDHKEEEQQENIIAKAGFEKQELKSEEDKMRETGKEEYDGLKRSMVEDKMRETEETDKTGAMEEDEIAERRKNTKDGSLGKFREGECPELGRHKRHGEEDRIHGLVEAEFSDHIEKIKKKDEDDISRSQETGKLDLGELERHCKQRKIHQSVEDEKGEGKVENIPQPGSGKFHECQKQKSYEDWIQEESKEIENFVKDEATDPRDKVTGGEGKHEEERYEKVAETKTKVEGEINKNAGENKEPESDKQERYGKLDKLEGVVVREAANDCEKEEENLVDDFTTKIQETEKEESHELEMHEKLYIVPDFVEDETGYQEDEEAAVARNESGSSRKVQNTEEESEKHKEQNKILETSDPEMQEEYEERVSEKETELEGKTENSKDDNGEGRREEKGKQGKTVETMPRERFKTKSDDGIVRKIRETKVKESNESENQEREGKIEELERKESSNHEVKLVTEEDSLRNGQEFLEKKPNVSKRRPVEEERIQQLKKVEKRDQVNEDEEKAEAETKIDNGKSREFEMSKLLEVDESKENEEQKKIRKTMEDKSTDPEIEKVGNEKISEDRIDSRTEDQEIKGQEPDELLKSGEHEKIPQYHREEENVMEQREIEEIKRAAEDVSSGKVQQIKAQEPDGLDKHRKLREIQENRNIQESMGKETQKHGEEEMNEGEEYKAVLQKKSMASSESQDVEEKGSDEPKRYAEQEKIQELMTEEGKEENHIRDGEQNEKTKIIPQAELKAHDDSSVKNETERHESTELRGERKKENHVETETSDQRKSETEEEVVEKAETKNEYDSSRKIHEHEERKSAEMSEKLAEEGTSDDKEGNRAGKVLGEVETKIGKVREIEEQGQEKKESFVEKDRSGKAKDNKNQETKRRDEKQEKIQEPVDRETSEDDEEELEVEFEDEEEDWEAEVIQEMDSDEDIEKIKQIKKIRLGFRLVGGSTLFMSLIVIVISFIRSKRKLRCYKF